MYRPRYNDIKHFLSFTDKLSLLTNLQTALLDTCDIPMLIDEIMKQKNLKRITVKLHIIGYEPVHDYTITNQAVSKFAAIKKFLSLKELII